MIKILCCITTYKRPQKLINLLESIYKSTWENYHVDIVFDNKDYDSQIEVSKFQRHLFHRSTVNENQEFVGANWNKLIVANIGYFDAYMMLVDDVLLEPDCIEKAIFDMGKYFPDTDGVIGITQIGKQRKFVPAGQCIIGKSFVERFKEVDYQVYCPQFLHWGIDTELWKYAEDLGKFHLSTEAKLEHLHPNWYPNLVDITHTLTRGNDLQKNDMKMLKDRQEKGLIWGKTWEKI